MTNIEIDIKTRSSVVIIMTIIFMVFICAIITFEVVQSNSLWNDVNIPLLIMFIVFISLILFFWLKVEFNKYKFKWPILILTKKWILDKYSFEHNFQFLEWKNIQWIDTAISPWLNRNSHSHYIQIALSQPKPNLSNIYSIRKKFTWFITYYNESQSIFINSEWLSWDLDSNLKIFKEQRKKWKNKKQ